MRNRHGWRVFQSMSLRLKFWRSLWVLAQSVGLTNSINCCRTLRKLLRRKSETIVGSLILLSCAGLFFHYWRNFLDLISALVKSVHLIWSKALIRSKASSISKVNWTKSATGGVTRILTLYIAVLSKLASFLKSYAKQTRNPLKAGSTLHKLGF